MHGNGNCLMFNVHMARFMGQCGRMTPFRDSLAFVYLYFCYGAFYSIIIMIMSHVSFAIWIAYVRLIEVKFYRNNIFFSFRNHQLDQWMGLVWFGFNYKSMPKRKESNGFKHFLHHFNLHCLNCHKYHPEQCPTLNKQQTCLMSCAIYAMYALWNEWMCTMWMQFM